MPAQRPDAPQLKLSLIERYELEHLRRKLALITREVTRAARGNPERSATKAARKLLRQLSVLR